MTNKNIPKVSSKNSYYTEKREIKIHQDEKDISTTFQRANLLLRSGKWEQAALGYLKIWEKQPDLRSFIAGSLRYLLRRAFPSGLSPEVVGRVSMVLREATFSENCEQDQNLGETEYSVVMSKLESCALGRALKACLGVEQVYVVNLARRPDRFVRILREMNWHGLAVKRVLGEDAMFSERAQQTWKSFRAKPVDVRGKSSVHVSNKVMSQYKSQLPPGVFGYILSQEKVLRDARVAGHRRILVLDDDVFFHSDAVQRINDIGRCLPRDLKVLLLGASEYSDRNSDEFVNSRWLSHKDLYTPLPGKSCGSFAMVYDESVYDELLAAIDEADGTFDNVILGSVYLNNPGKCLAVDPAICIPDVNDSDIRQNVRLQTVHSARMNWETLRYADYTKPLLLTVIVNSIDSLRHIESMQHELNSKIFLNVFYLSEDGIRPVITGHRFSPVDSEVVKIKASSSTSLRRSIDVLRIPRSDIVLSWPAGRLLTEDSALAVYADAMQVMNSTGMKDGVIDNVNYSIDAGVSPVPGRHSIIIPSYRNAQCIWPTVKSALLQDVKDFEVIVVNDNPDHDQFSSEIRSKALAWEKESGFSGCTSRLIVIDHKKNRNGAAARNTGLAYSSGEFISFLDDDDHYEPNRLSGINAGFIGADEDVGASYCGYTGNWNGERNMGRFPEGDLREHVIALRYTKHYMCTNTITFLRSSLQRIGGFNEGYTRHQDLELMVRYFGLFRISSVSEFLVKNRPNPVPETFVADVHKLSSIKHQFLSDMRLIICNMDQEIIGSIIDAHAADIVKRDKSAFPISSDLIKTFLMTALN